MLRQPVWDRLAGARSVLLAGCGGGWDVFGAVPLAVELRARPDPPRVHLASLSFCSLEALAGAARDPELPNLYRVAPEAATRDAYAPEAWLARWLATRPGLDACVWGLEKTGVEPLARAYERLAERLALDAVVLVDGGIDALLRGDESSLGTPSEDLASLAALRRLRVPVKLLACVGLGAELRDGIAHAQALERVADRARDGSFLGAAALAPGSEAAAAYREAVDLALEGQATQKTSHVHGCIRRALDGEHGERGAHVWLSSLMTLYWFFDLDAVARAHLFLEHLAGTQTIWDVVARIEAIRKTLDVRARERIPL